jgi:triosephosphate isomerase
MSRRPLIAGNWKMNGLKGSIAEAAALVEALKAGAAGTGDALQADVLLCPPFTLIGDVVRAGEGSALLVGGQTCHPEPSGAHTGEVSAEMIADLGAGWVIVGHSERREAGETDADVRARLLAGGRAGLSVIVCVGETLEERDAGEASVRVRAQITAALSPDPGLPPDRMVIAYEPVWAIGTGRTPSLDDIAEMHGAIRDEIADRLGSASAERTKILYGGSVKPENAQEILAVEGVDGALVGGASLKALTFIEILKSV